MPVLDKGKRRWMVKRSYCRKKGKEMCSLEEFMEFWNQKHICSYCGVTEKQWLTIKKKALEIDRMDNNKSYVKGNMVFACRRCNIVKSDVFTFDEMKEIANKYIKPKLKLTQKEAYNANIQQRK